MKQLCYKNFLIKINKFILNLIAIIVRIEILRVD